MRRLLCAFFLPFSLCIADVSLDSLSLEEKIGQLLLCHFHGDTANEESAKLLEQAHIGGFIYYTWANELSSPAQIKKLSSSLQTMNKSSLPLLITVDQEGGVISHLTQGFTLFPGQGALGAINNSQLTAQAAYIMAQEMRAVGINLNLAPVVDINTNPQNPVIGIRSFGNSAANVASLGKATLQGYHAANLLTCLKHFPGHGDTSTDSHLTLPVVNKTKRQLQQVELFPFAALTQDTDCIMTAHVMIPSIDPTLPASLSKEILEILRTRLQFEGLIISDSLIMEGILQITPSIEEAAVMAFNAGCDLLILGGRPFTKERKELTPDDIIRIHAYLTKAVTDGTITEQRLNESVERIIRLKQRITLDSEPSLDVIATTKSQHLAKQIASSAMTVIKRPPLVTLRQSKITLFAPDLLKPSIETLSSLLSAKQTEPFFFSSLSEEEISQAVSASEASEALVFCSYNAWKNSDQQTLIKTLSQQKKPFVLIALRDPIDTTLAPQAQGLIITRSPTQPSVEAALNYLLLE